MLSISLAYCLLLSLALTRMRVSSHLSSLVRSSTTSASAGRSCSARQQTRHTAVTNNAAQRLLYKHHLVKQESHRMLQLYVIS
jgi:hypothetical protein